MITTRTSIRAYCYPASAIDEGGNETEESATKVIAGDFPTIFSEEKAGQNVIRPPPGTLPKSAGDLTGALRGLLVRLLERDPKVRMRSLRQLQQSALYMGFNFEHVKAKKISPKSILERHFPLIEEPSDGVLGDSIPTNDFPTFDQPAVID